MVADLDVRGRWSGVPWSRCPTGEPHFDPPSIRGHHGTVSPNRIGYRVRGPRDRPRGLADLSCRWRPMATTGPGGAHLVLVWRNDHCSGRFPGAGTRLHPLTRQIRDCRIDRCRVTPCRTPHGVRAWGRTGSLHEPSSRHRARLTHARIPCPRCLSRKAGEPHR